MNVKFIYMPLILTKNQTSAREVCMDNQAQPVISYSNMRLVFKRFHQIYKKYIKVQIKDLIFLSNRRFQIEEMNI